MVIETLPKTITWLTLHQGNLGDDRLFLDDAEPAPLLGQPAALFHQNREDGASEFTWDLCRRRLTCLRGGAPGPFRSRSCTPTPL